MKTPISEQIQIGLLQLLTVSFLVFFAGTSTAKTADQNEVLAAAESRSIVERGDGLLHSLPTVDKSSLLLEVTDLRSQLSARAVALQQKVDDKQFSGSDLLVIAIVPGGLLYSAMKRQQLARAEQQLQQVNQQLDEISMDQLALEYAELDMKIAVNF